MPSKEGSPESSPIAELRRQFKKGLLVGDDSNWIEREEARRVRSTRLAAGLPKEYQRLFYKQTTPLVVAPSEIGAPDPERLCLLGKTPKDLNAIDEAVEDTRKGKPRLFKEARQEVLSRSRIREAAILS